MCNNPYLYLVNINAYKKFGAILSICSQDIERKQHFERNSDIKGHNSGTNAWKMMCNNLNLDLININAYTKFGEILSIFLNILIRNEIMTDRWKEWWRTQIQYSPLFKSGAVNPPL